MKDPYRHYGMNYDTDRSDSSEEIDPCFIADETPDGIPEKCFCGRRVLVQHEESGDNKGRAYYACNPTHAGPQFRDGPHFRKWWDYSVTEEVTALKTKTGEQAIRIQHLESENAKKSNEIEELKGRLVELRWLCWGKPSSKVVVC